MKKILTLILFATSFLLTRAESYQIKIIDGDSELTFICDDDQTIYESAKLSVMIWAMIMILVQRV